MALCGGQLEILCADKTSMDVQCIECDEDYTVERNAFNDGGIKYWQRIMENPIAESELDEEF